MQDVVTDREKFIGGSDVPCIMGILPFKKRFDLLLEKAQLQDNNFAGNEYTEYGNVMEEKIRNFLNKGKKKPYLEDCVIDGDLRYHSDGFDGKEVLEIKTTSKIHDDVNEYKVYLVQLLFGIQIHKGKKGKLAVYERPQDFNEEFDENRLKVHEIDIKDYKELVEDINAAVDQFRVDLAKVKANPFITEEELQPKELIECSNKLLELNSKLHAYKQLEAQYEEFKQSMYKFMSEYQIKQYDTLKGLKFTRVDEIPSRTVIEKKFDEQSFKNDNPEQYKKYMADTKVEKKGKKGYVLIKDGTV